MTVSLKIPFTCVVLLIVSAMPEHVRAATYKAEAMEIAQLPHFCWAQYLDNVSGPEYSIDRNDCGVGMNHYCPGLVQLMRAKRSFGDRNKRLGYLKGAKGETLYTVKAMRGFPGCSLRGHVEKTLNEINGYLKGLGQK
jgi:hypothetical protein